MRSLVCSFLAGASALSRTHSRAIRVDHPSLTGGVVEPPRGGFGLVLLLREPARSRREPPPRMRRPGESLALSAPSYLIARNSWRASPEFCRTSGAGYVGLGEPLPEDGEPPRPPRRRPTHHGEAGGVRWLEYCRLYS